MRIIALDPGYDRCGIAVLEQQEKETIIFSECFQTNKKETLPERLFAIGKRLDEIITTYQPTILVLEDLFFSKNTTTALGVSQARGVIVYQGMNHGLAIYEFTPNQVKVAVTGYGAAKKEDVHTMAAKLITLEDKKYLDDEIDAIAVGLTFLASHKMQ